MPQPSSSGLVCSIGPLKALVDEGCCQQMVQDMLASVRSHSIEVVSSPNGALEGALEPPFRGLSGAAPRCLIGARVAMNKRAHCCQSLIIICALIQRKGWVLVIKIQAF